MLLFGIIDVIKYIIKGDSMVQGTLYRVDGQYYILDSESNKFDIDYTKYNVLRMVFKYPIKIKFKVSHSEIVDIQLIEEISPIQWIHEYPVQLLISKVNNIAKFESEVKKLIKKMPSAMKLFASHQLLDFFEGLDGLTREQQTSIKEILIKEGLFSKENILNQISVENFEKYHSIESIVNEALLADLSEDNYQRHLLIFNKNEQFKNDPNVLSKYGVLNELKIVRSLPKEIIVFNRTKNDAYALAWLKLFINDEIIDYPISDLIEVLQVSMKNNSVYKYLSIIFAKEPDLVKQNEFINIIKDKELGFFEQIPIKFLRKINLHTANISEARLLFLYKNNVPVAYEKQNEFIKAFENSIIDKNNIQWIFSVYLNNWELIKDSTKTYEVIKNNISNLTFNVPTIELMRDLISLISNKQDICDQLPDSLKRDPFFYGYLSEEEQLIIYKRERHYVINSLWAKTKDLIKIKALFDISKSIQLNQVNRDEYINIYNYVGDEFKNNFVSQSYNLIAFLFIRGFNDKRNYNDFAIFQDMYWKYYESIFSMEDDFKNEVRLPVCPEFNGNSWRYCEGKRYVKEQCAYCPRLNRKCFLNFTAKLGGLEGAHIYSDFKKDWTLVEMFDFAQIEYTETVTDSHYVNKLAGWTNRLLELKKRLYCKTCLCKLKPENEYSKRFTAKYLNTLFTCVNPHCANKEKIYFNHCWNCTEIIDSRECKRGKNSYYICKTCSAGHKQYDKPGEVCPNKECKDGRLVEFEKKGKNHYYKCTTCGKTVDIRSVYS